MTAEYKVHGSVAVITMANPPVNGLGLATRQGIVDGLSLNGLRRRVDREEARPCTTPRFANGNAGITASSCSDRCT